MVAIVSDKREFILGAVADVYTDVALHPGKQFHFPTGRPACLFVGYPAAQLDRLPATAVESFAGVGHPFAAGVIREGDVVLDIGAGSGTDTLLAGLLASRGTVYGLDMTRPMLDKLSRNIALMGAHHVHALEGNAEQIPMPDASVDVVTSNGVLNLVPDKARAFAEIARVLKPGGRLQVADIALDNPVSTKSRADPKLWAECVVGAVVEARYIELLHAAGLDVELIARQDYFSASASADTRRAARSLGAHAITLRGVRREKGRPAVRVLARRWAGLLAWTLSLLTCYGLLALLPLLAALGLAVAPDATAWAAAIMFFAALAAAAVAAGRGWHRRAWPTMVATGAVLLLAWVMFVRFDRALELVGFALLGIAVFADRSLRREAGCG